MLLQKQDQIKSMLLVLMLSGLWLMKKFLLFYLPLNNLITRDIFLNIKYQLLQIGNDMGYTFRLYHPSYFSIGYKTLYIMGLTCSSEKKGGGSRKGCGTNASSTSQYGGYMYSYKASLASRKRLNARLSNSKTKKKKHRRGKTAKRHRRHRRRRRRGKGTKRRHR